MNKIKEYTEKVFEEIKHIDEYGNEYWYARELSKVLEYRDWRNFFKVLKKAKEACENSGIDVDVKRMNGVTEATAKEAVSIFVQIPSPYIGQIECAVNTETVEIHSLECDSIELDVKTSHVTLDDISGTVEINCNLDMEVLCSSLNGEVDINQISATSRIHIPENTVFTAVTKGIGTSISYEKDGQQTDRFDTSDSENIIELNGIKSELVIYTGKGRC